MTEIEICVDAPEALAIALKENLSRIELCSALEAGGLTPSVGMMEMAGGNDLVPVYAMIRPRSGSFTFTPAEEEVMLTDIAAARSAGLTGVVLGASKPNGSLDTDMLSRLSGACGPLKRTLHRVFDLTPDPFDALETAIDLGFERILTSGGALRAEQGISVLSALVLRARKRIAIMAGSGISPDNAATIVLQTGVTAVHGSFRAPQNFDAEDADAIKLGFGRIPSLPNHATIQNVRTQLAALRRSSDLA